MKKSPSPRDLDDMAETRATGCPLTAAINAIGGKWNLIILYWLHLGPRRFNELRRLMPEISHKVLAETLHDLERERLVARAAFGGAPARVEYSIAQHGESVLPLLHAVREWGRQHLEHGAASQPRNAAREGNQTGSRAAIALRRT